VPFVSKVALKIMLTKVLIDGQRSKSAVMASPIPGSRFSRPWCRTMETFWHHRSNLLNIAKCQASSTKLGHRWQNCSIPAQKPQKSVWSLSLAIGTRGTLPRPKSNLPTISRQLENVLVLYEGRNSWRASQAQQNDDSGSFTNKSKTTLQKRWLANEIHHIDREGKRNRRKI